MRATALRGSGGTGPFPTPLIRGIDLEAKLSDPGERARLLPDEPELPQLSPDWSADPTQRVWGWQRELELHGYWHGRRYGWTGRAAELGDWGSTAPFESALNLTGPTINLGSIDPTEDLINGAHPGQMEEHFVNTSTQGGEVVLAVFIQIGIAPNPTLDTFFGALKSLPPPKTGRLKLNSVSPRVILA